MLYLLSQLIMLLLLAFSSLKYNYNHGQKVHVDTFEQNKRFLSASFRNYKKDLFCR